MKNANRALALVLSLVASAVGSWAVAQDWPQWRGSNRDATVSGFQAPATWPPELTQKWRVAVGEGVSTPALVGARFYVFSRQEGHEITRCLDVATGEELWQDKYETAEINGAALRFASRSGPRCSPSVTDGKVVTLGVQGTLSCLDAATGNVLWRNTDFEGSVPRFFPSSSPIIVDGLCIAQLGSDRDGSIMAFDLATGEETWKWTGDGPAYGSPVLMTLNGTKVIVAPTASNMVAVDAADGKLLWKIAYSQGRYNAATPIVYGQHVIYAGPTRGVTAVKMEKEGDEHNSTESWSNPDNSLMYNTPVVKNGLLFGLSNLNSLFCINAETGETMWNAPLGESPGGERPQIGREGRAREGRTQEGRPQGGQGREGGRGQRRGRRGGPGGGGYGSIVDAGSVLLALNPTSLLIVFEPSDKEFKQLASYKVAESQTYAYPVIAGNRVFVKDQDSVTLWTIE